MTKSTMVLSSGQIPSQGSSPHTLSRSGSKDHNVAYTRTFFVGSVSTLVSLSAERVTCVSFVELGKDHEVR